MQTVGIVLGPIFALLGVLLGGAITSRAQRRALEFSTKHSINEERRDACVQFLSAVRSYRRYVTYSDVSIEEVKADEASKGVVIVEGSESYNTRLDEALCRVLVIVQSDSLAAQAQALASDLNKFIRIRAQKGSGRIPNDEIAKFRKKELDFAHAARSELGYPAEFLG